MSFKALVLQIAEDIKQLYNTVKTNYATKKELEDRLKEAEDKITKLKQELAQTKEETTQSDAIKTAYNGPPILLSKNMNKTLCKVDPSWHILFIDWREGTNTGWSTYTSVMVNSGGFFQFRFQNCPFALQINAQGELKCFSMDEGEEGFIKRVLFQ